MGAGFARLTIVLVALAACGRSRFDELADGRSDDGAPAADDAMGDSGTMSDTPAGMLVGRVTVLSNVGAPTARRATGAAVANDNRLWVFGGFVGGIGAVPDFFVYAPATGSWSQVSTAGAPTARERHTLVWDASKASVIVFSGYSATLTHLDELYAYTPSNNTWTSFPVAGMWPGARKDAAMFWVPSQSKLLLYGGNNGSGTANRFSDLWYLSIDLGGPSAFWTQLTPGGVAAPAQSATCAGYDPAAHRLIVFGGQTQDSTCVATTYQYLVDSNVWQLDTPTGNVPSARAFSNCTWDPDMNRLVLYGGQDSAGTPLNGTYAYDPDAKRWDILPPAMGSVVLGTCGDAGAVYNPSLGALIMFGGRTGASSYSGETRTLDLIYE